MPPPAGPASRHFLKVAAVPSNSGRKPVSGLRADDGIGDGQHAAIQQVARSSAEGNAGEHRIGRTNGRKQRGACDIAIRRVVDPAEVVGHGIGNVVSHPHRAGIMMGRAEIVAASLECGERGQPLRQGAGGHRNYAVRARREFRTARCPQRSVRSCRTPRPSRPRSPGRCWFRHCRETAAGSAFALPRGDHRLGRSKSVSVVDRSTKLSGLRGVISPIPRMVMTTVSSVARSMSSRCSSVGIFLNSSASESMPSLLNPAAVIWK